jgi:hypothetical protein
MRKLASIQKISDIIEIPGADNIEIVQILGWKCVAKKGEFSIGDYCVYFEVDSKLPRHEIFSFMEPRKYVVKTARFMKLYISQGLALPTSIIAIITGNDTCSTFTEGDDVTQLLGVVKHDPEGDAELLGTGISAYTKFSNHKKLHYILMKYKLYRKLYNTFSYKPKGSFPAGIPKTDEDRIQNTPNISTRYEGAEFYITEKYDGQSLTVFYNKNYKKWYNIFGDDYRFGVCSRNIWIKTKHTCNWWNAVDTYDIKTKLIELCNLYNTNLALQMEIVGPGIQGNKYNLSKQQIFIFSIFNIDKGEYLSYNEKMKAIEILGLNHVPILFKFVMDKDEHTIDWFVKNATINSTLNNSKLAEGIVCRYITDDSISFKAISPEFLLTYKI